MLHQHTSRHPLYTYGPREWPIPTAKPIGCTMAKHCPVFVQRTKRWVVPKQTGNTARECPRGLRLSCLETMERRWGTANSAIWASSAFSHRGIEVSRPRSPFRILGWRQVAPWWMSSPVRVTTSCEGDPRFKRSTVSLDWSFSDPG